MVKTVAWEAVFSAMKKKDRKCNINDNAYVILEFVHVVRIHFHSSEPFLMQLTDTVIVTIGINLIVGIQLFLKIVE